MEDLQNSVTTLAPVGVHTPVARVPGGDSLMAMSASSVKSRVQAIQQVMEAVMKRGVHYDVIPGTEKQDKDGRDISKPTLLKPGAEVICMTFGLTPDISIAVTGDHPTVEYHWKDRKKNWFNGSKGRTFEWVEEEGDTLGYYEVIATCRIYGGADNRLLASATGSCNNREKKYRNVNVYDVRNTVGKMAAKRAFVAATLLATAASDCFSQDLEDDDDNHQHPQPKPQSKQPEQTQGWLSEAQGKLLVYKGKKGGFGGDVINHVIGSINAMGKAKGKAWFDKIADDKPEAAEIWQKAKDSVAAASRPADPPPPQDEPPMEPDFPM